MTIEQIAARLDEAESLLAWYAREQDSEVLCDVGSEYANDEGQKARAYFEKYYPEHEMFEH